MLGSYIVEHLAREGTTVRALVRDLERDRWLRELGADCVQGDIRDAASLARASDGCDVIFHTAAEIGPRGDEARYRAGNVVGTSNVVAAAEGAGARLVHISSTAVYSRETRYRAPPTAEDVEYGPLDADDTYGRTKADAEKVVLDASRAGRIWGTAVRPPPIYGRRDRQFIPRFAPVLRRGFFPLVRGGRAIFGAVHAGSIAEGALLAARHDAACGRAYNLTNDVDVTVADFIRLASEGLGVRVRMPSVPYFVAKAGTRTLAAAMWAVGRGALAPHANGLILMFGHDNPFSSARARAELGWNPSPRPEVVIPEAFRWWREHHGSANATR